MPTQRDPHEQKILDDIQQYGWHVVEVRASRQAPAFAYTIGLMETYGHPELILLGLDPQTTHGIFKVMVEEIEQGRSFTEPLLYEDVIVGFACATRCVHISQHPEYLGYGMWYRRHIGKIGTLDTVQVFWPDKQGRFPWEPDCDDVATSLQPLLFEPLEDGLDAPMFSQN